MMHSNLYRVVMTLNAMFKSLYVEVKFQKHTFFKMENLDGCRFLFYKQDFRLCIETNLPAKLIPTEKRMLFHLRNIYPQRPVSLRFPHPKVYAV